MKNDGLNIAKNDKIHLHNSSRLPDKGFTWYRGRCVFQEVNDIDLLSTINIQSYTPDFKSAVIDFANLNILDKKAIANIIKKYGLLGLVHFYKEGKGVYFWKTHLVDFNWCSLLGIDEPTITPFLSGLSSSAKHDFWGKYREPLEVYQNTIARFQEVVSVLVSIESLERKNPAGIYMSKEHTELRWATQKIGPLPITLSYLPNGQSVWSMPAESLILALYSYLFWTFKNKYPIRQCPTCKKFLWADDRQHRRLYCNNDCAMDPVRNRENEKKKVVRQSKKKTGEDIAKDTGISLDRIKEILGREKQK